MKVDMMGVPQSRWGHLEVLWLNTYVPPKTPRQPFPIPIIFRADPSDVAPAGRDNTHACFERLRLLEVTVLGEPDSPLDLPRRPPLVNPRDGRDREREESCC